MSEIWAAIRDSIGLHSTVSYSGKKVVIKDLPVASYNLSHERKCFAQSMSPNQIPGVIMSYCTGLEERGSALEGDNFVRKVNNLDLIVEKTD